MLQYVFLLQPSLCTVTNININLLMKTGSRSSDGLAAKIKYAKIRIYLGNIYKFLINVFIQALHCAVGADRCILFGNSKMTQIWRDEGKECDVSEK